MIRIAGATVVNHDGTHDLDVLVDGHRIEALIPRDELTPGADVIDANGTWVIPGGVDPHVHLELTQKGFPSADDFATGTQAAAWGGTTTIIDFADQTKGDDLIETLDARLAAASGRCAIDYSFHQVIGDVNDRSLAQMADVVARGIMSFKLFMAYPGAYYSDDGEILLAMQRAGELGAMVLVHAENGIAIDVLVAQALARGDVEPIHHGLSRPPGLEAEAVDRAVRLGAEAQCPVYIVHLSSADALEEVRHARRRGAVVYAETCPQYLVLSLDRLDQGWAGANYVCSPPLRTADHAGALWEGLADGTLDVIATDHAPFHSHQRDVGRNDFSKMPNGLGTIEHRLQLSFDRGVANGRFTPNRWVELVATQPARLFGLYPAKGTLAAGADADLVVWDPDGTTNLSAATHHMAVDVSAYEGMETRGAVRTVLSRGALLVHEGTWVGPTDHGAFLKRSQPRGEQL